EEDADTETMLRIIRLRDIKKKLDLPFTITAEIRCENNRKLINSEDSEDFIVATDLSSMMLAQITEDPRRVSLFNDILDEGGSEIYLKPASDFGLAGSEMGITELRRKLYAFGYILLGIRTDNEAFKMVSDDAPVSIMISEKDRFILIGEE
ncbi:MAG: hypothetical protein J5528_02315, partial [Firmicutes bacterium]|nr:hypothetical protein [Bacillota bacterium]